MSPHDFKFNIERTFDAPRERVWKAWTNEDQLLQWFSPKGMPGFYSKLDFRVGGTYHYGLRLPNGDAMWGRWIFKEIKEPEKLVFIVSFSDETGKNITTHPMSPNWPKQTLSTVTFAPAGDKTKITVVWQVHEASDIEAQTFEKGRDSMNQGWTGTFEQLEEFLAIRK